MDKEDLFVRVLNSAIELDYKKGHLKWSMTNLAEKSGVKRPTIYYHFGRTKENILRQAVEAIGEQIVRLDEWGDMLWREGGLETGLAGVRGLTKRMPMLSSFYGDHRNRPGEIGDAIKAIEDRFMTRIKRECPDITQQQSRTIYSIYLGLIFSPVLKDEDYSPAISAVRSVLQASTLH